MKNVIIGSIFIVVIVFAIFQSFQISALSKTIGAGDGQKSGSGETYEQMMARMHPDQASAQANAPSKTRYSAAQSPQMVGGC